MDVNVLRKIAYGVYIIGSKDDDKINGQTANTVFQVTSEPCKIAISINKANLTHEYIKKSRAFSIMILDENAPINLIGYFGFRSGREVNKFEGREYVLSKNLGLPVLRENVVGYIELELEQELNVGSHTLFIGKAIDGEYFSDEAPLTYENYHKKKSGKEPASAPTFIKEK